VKYFVASYQIIWFMCERVKCRLSAIYSYVRQCTTVFVDPLVQTQAGV